MKSTTIKGSFLHCKADKIKYIISNWLLDPKVGLENLAIKKYSFQNIALYFIKHAFPRIWNIMMEIKARTWLIGDHTEDGHLTL